MSGSQLFSFSLYLGSRDQPHVIGLLQHAPLPGKFGVIFPNKIFIKPMLCIHHRWAMSKTWKKEH